MKTRPMIRTFAMFGTLTLTFMACGGGTPSALSSFSPAQSAAANATPKGPVAISYGLASSPQLPFYAADKLGFFTQNGLTVTTISSEESQVRHNALIGRTIDFLLTPPNSSVAASAGGAKLKAIMGVLNVSLLYLMVRPGISSIKDLKGKVGVTFTIGDNQYVLGNRMLSEAGLNPTTDVSWLAAGGNPGVLAALTSGRADFTLTSAPNIFQLEDAGFKTLVKGRETNIAFPTLSVITRQDVIDRDPEAVLRFTKSIAQTIKALKADRAKAVELLLEMQKSTNRPLMERTYDWLVPSFEADCVPADGLENIKADVAKDVPEAAKLKIADLVDESFVKRLATTSDFGVTSKRCGV
jgi:NitT/TauT family transport system substrate-binding protein